MSILKLKYNDLLKRHQKAELFYEDEKIPEAKKEGWLPEYIKLTNEIQEVLAEIEKSGPVTYDEIIRGFEIEQYQDQLCGNRIQEQDGSRHSASDKKTGV